MTITLDGNSLKLEDVGAVAYGTSRVEASPHALKHLTHMRHFVQEAATGSVPIYGINTGFGALSEKSIPPKDLQTLQRNLILSHAVGVGTPLSIPKARALMVLRANTLLKGFSGCSPIIIDLLAALLNHDCAPLVPCKGSVGASGDLAPLAHLAMLLIGEGDAFYKETRLPAKQVLAKCGLEPIVLGPKDGLCLINGTQAMAAVGSLSLIETQQLLDLADIAGACSVEALLGSHKPFDERIHAQRSHPGQAHVANHLRSLLQNSELNQSHTHCERVQDAYSLRCMPQVHGASYDVAEHVKQILEREINSATDNPLVFLNDQEPHGFEILSGGNFHGQPLALAFDYLGMAVSELANISERRIEQLVNPALSNGLPPFLAPNAGLNSGFMILQVTAAALVNESKVLCHPASTDSIPTSANREDHVSMGMTSANKLVQIIENTKYVLTIELMTACQALDLRLPLTPGKGVASIWEKVRQVVPFAPHDRAFGEDLQTLVKFTI